VPINNGQNRLDGHHEPPQSSVHMPPHNRAPNEIVASESPPGFFCPLTGILMRDPVLLRDSAISYERNALEWSLHRDPDRCPVSGLVLTERTLYDDVDLRRRIEAWAAANKPDVLVRS
jgi:U-box domain